MRRRLLFVHNGTESFVQQDHALLAREYVIDDWYQPSRVFNPAQLRRMVKTNDLVFCWFASWHSLAPVMLARRLNKPAVVVIGGYDTASVPEAGYGLQRGGIRRNVARLIIRLATHLVPFSYAAREEAITNAGADPAKIAVIYPGVEPLPVGPLSERERIVLTIGGVWRENLLRKGLLPFVQAAALLPDVRFIHAGKWHDDSMEILRRAAPPNVEFHGFVSHSELSDLCRRAAVYVQASLHEGFGLSVAEAMSAGCIPVVTSAGSLPEVVQDYGITIRSNRPDDIAAGIQQALLLDCTARERARDHIVTSFPMRRRAAALGQLIEAACA